MSSPAPLIYAHRGASFDFPEMSREAYLGAVSQGADGFETDLRLTKDRVIVCWHDVGMKRVADCDLVIANSTFAQIRAVYPVLSLEQLLEIALEHGKHLALETKHPVRMRGAIERELLKLLSTYDEKISKAKISISIMSFSWLATLRLRKSRWNTVYLISHGLQRFLAVSTAIGPSISVISNLKKGRVKKPIYVWTANTEVQILLCREKEISVMMTDRPAFARAILESA